MVSVPEHEYDLRFVRAGGPGGQNVNKVATAVQLFWRFESSTLLNRRAKARLRRIARNRINTAGELVIEAREHRSQAQNRTAALKRLESWIRRAQTIPKPRKPTRPPAAAKERRLRDKRHRGERKRQRRKDIP